MVRTLIGRDAERAALDDLVRAACLGRGGALVVRGEAGIGKTALAEHVTRTSRACRVVRAVGVESEMALPYAGLQQVCADLPPLRPGVPEVQVDALERALGRRAGGPADRYLVGLGLLSWWSDAAARQPLVCVVDDAQWWDDESAQALAFAARRLQQDPAAVVVLTRRPDTDGDAFTGLPSLNLHGLHRDDARRLLALATPGALDEQVADRLIAEAAGNPLALLELPRRASPADLAGGFAPGPAPVDGLAREYARRLAMLPAATRRFLLLLAADPSDDPPVRWAAAARLGLRAEQLEPAEAAGWLTADQEFRHPLMRTAVYRSATPAQRRAAHAALAAGTDGARDPDRLAWHHALACAAPDEAVAAELVAAADRARRRGGLCAAGAFLDRAATLTPEPRRRADRLLQAAQEMELAGVPSRALTLLDRAEAAALTEVDRLRCVRLRGRVQFAINRGGVAAGMLLEAADGLRACAPDEARATYLEVLAAGIFAAGPSSSKALTTVAEHARHVPRSDGLLDDVLDAAVSLVLDPREQSAPAMRAAVAALAEPDVPLEAALRWGWLTSRFCVLTWAEQEWSAEVGRVVQRARRHGAITALVGVLSSQMALQVLRGDMDAAALLAEEATAASEAIATPVIPYGPVVIAAFEGPSPSTQTLLSAVEQRAQADKEEMLGALVRWARMVLMNAQGRWDEALREGRRLREYPQVSIYTQWGLGELVEAAARAGAREVASAALGELQATTDAVGSTWAAGVALRSRAVLSTGGEADGCFEQAVACLQQTTLRVEEARARLLYGEYLRRRRRRGAAAQQLAAALATFEGARMLAFAGRARQELAMCGARGLGASAADLPAQRHPGLTSQEWRIAALAAEGLSNGDIAGRLFISTNTVDYHLRKVYAKLGVGSRARLHAALTAG